MKGACLPDSQLNFNSTVPFLGVSSRRQCCIDFRFFPHFLLFTWGCQMSLFRSVERQVHYIASTECSLYRTNLVPGIFLEFFWHSMRYGNIWIHGIAFIDPSLSLARKTIQDKCYKRGSVLKKEQKKQWIQTENIIAICDDNDCEIISSISLM